MLQSSILRLYITVKQDIHIILLSFLITCPDPNPDYDPNPNSQHIPSNTDQNKTRKPGYTGPLSPYQFPLISIHFHEFQYSSGNFNTFTEGFTKDRQR